MPDVSDAADPEFAYLTTTGRRTGEPHTVELWYRRTDDGTVWFLAGDPSSDWVRNAQAGPDVEVRIGDGPIATGVAFVGGEHPEVRRLFADRYQGGRMTEWARTSTAVAVRGVPSI